MAHASKDDDHFINGCQMRKADVEMKNTLPCNKTHLCQLWCKTVVKSKLIYYIKPVCYFISEYKYIFHRSVIYASSKWCVCVCVCLVIFEFFDLFYWIFVFCLAFLCCLLFGLFSVYMYAWKVTNNRQMLFHKKNAKSKKM